MKYENRKIAGLLFFVGGVLAVLGIIVAEALYPSYSTSKNYISDLGVGPSAFVFNSSMTILGVMGLCGTYFIQKTFNFKPFTVVAVMASIGALGVGLFTEDAGFIHGLFSFIVFFFAGLSAIASYRIQNPPFSYLSTILGCATLLALVLFGSSVFLGLDKGGMERMIAYPALLWAIGFGGYLIGSSKEPGTRNTK